MGIPPWLARCIPTTLLLMLGLRAGDGPAALQAAAVVVTAIVLFRAAALTAALGNPLAVTAYLHQPIADAHAARLLLRPAWAAFAWSAVDGLVLHGTACLVLGVDPAWAVPWALCQAAVVVGGAIWLALALPRAIGCLSMLGVPAAFVALHAGLNRHTPLASLARPLLEASGSGSPIGWITLALQQFAGGTAWTCLIPAALAAAALAAIPEGLRRLHARYRPGEPEAERFAAPQGEDAAPRALADVQAPPREDAAVAEAWHRTLAIPAGDRLRRTGRLGRCGAALLPRRLLPAADALRPDGDWDRRWLLALGLVLAAGLLRLIGVTAPLPIGVLLCLAAASGLPLVGGPWLGTAQTGTPHPLALLPLRGRDLARILLTGNAVRIAAFLPLALLGGAALPIALPWPERLQLAAEAWAVLLAAHPLWLTAAVSGLLASTGGMSRFGIGAALLLLCVVVIGGSFAVGVFAAPLPIALGCWAGVAGTCSLLLAYYLFAWNRLAVDVLH